MLFGKASNERNRAALFQIVLIELDTARCAVGGVWKSRSEEDLPPGFSVLPTVLVSLPDPRIGGYTTWHTAYAHRRKWSKRNAPTAWLQRLAKQRAALLSNDGLRLLDLPRIAFVHARQMTPFAKDRADPPVFLFPELKIAYFPIPKAASSSIRAELLRLAGAEPDTFKKSRDPRGMERRLFKQCSHLLTSDWLVFTVVRDPYSRVASAFLNKVVHRNPIFPALRRMGLGSNDSFVRFLRVLSIWPSRVLDKHVAPQSELLRAPLATIPHLRVIKIENIDTEWVELSAEIGKRTGIALGSLGRRNRGVAPKIDLYTPPARKLVEKIYEEDFRVFGYAVSNTVDYTGGPQSART